jgi:hypothetical protein
VSIIEFCDNVVLHVHPFFFPFESNFQSSVNVSLILKRLDASTTAPCKHAAHCAPAAPRFSASAATPVQPMGPSQAALVLKINGSFDHNILSLPCNIFFLKRHLTRAASLLL